MAHCHCENGNNCVWLTSRNFDKSRTIPDQSPTLSPNLFTQCVFDANATSDLGVAGAWMSAESLFTTGSES
ncbi:hypothetical protein BDB13_5512 [Rhodococcus sp. OK302]|nr:hypothetical protein BDB13_5512 [Rhodococcus sp. OK302]